MINGVIILYDLGGHDDIDIKEIIRILKKSIKLIILIPIIFALIGALISIFFIEPVYKATTKIIVSQSNDSTVAISKGDVDLSKSLIYTYAEIANSSTVRENTKISLNLTELNSNAISVSAVKDTQILKIEVINTDPKLAMDIANNFVWQFTQEVIRITRTDNVAVVDYAKMPNKPVSPNVYLNTAFAGILGEIIILVITFFLEYLDNTIKTERDIEKYIKISLIGTIPNFNKGGKLGYGYAEVHGERSSSVTNNGRI